LENSLLLRTRPVKNIIFTRDSAIFPLEIKFENSTERLTLMSGGINLLFTCTINQEEHMGKAWRMVAAACTVIAVVMVPGGCGGQKKIKLAEARIQALSAKGVPDSVLAGPRVFIFQVNATAKLGQTGIMRRNRDSLMVTLEKAEIWYEETMRRLKPELETQMRSLNERKQGLTGLQLAVADSIAGIVDSFTAINWLLQAKQKADILDGIMAGLINDEALMQKLRPRVIGTWKGEASPEDKKLKAVERRKFIFGADGKLQIEEEMKGQTQEFLREDWKFVSWGRWDMKGDTALLYIEREKCERQTYWTLKNEAWVKEDKPTYDSTITNRSKDRFMAWDYFEQFLKKAN
jgi:hypothetical protein